MKKNMLRLLAVGISLLLVTCADPLQQMKLSHREIVTICFISPQDTALRAIVYWTEPLYFVEDFSGYHGDPRARITNATVKISDGSNSAQLNHVFDSASTHKGGFGYGYNSNYFLTSGYYTVKTSLFPILAGKTYSLTVILPDSTIARASCTVPAEVPQIGLNYHNTTNNDSLELWRGDMHCNYEIHWRDLTGTSDYYRVMFKADWGRDYIDPKCFGQGANGTRGWVFDFIPDQTLFNDNIADGMDYTYKDFFFYSSCGLRVDTISAQVLHVDKHYYYYHRSILDQEKAKENPYNEPSLIYTNFEGGVGVFAAYNRTQVTRQFVY